MPELPEVEVIRRGLLPLVKNRKILSVSYSNKPLRKPFQRSKMYSLVENAFILDLERRARFLIFRLTGRGVICIHLGMTGKIGLFPADSPRRPHDHLRFLLDDGREMRLNDARRFGWVEVFSGREFSEENPFADFGPEPFSEEFSADLLLERAKGRKTPVKTFLMDNRIVAGIGNIYANEILFAAATHPASPAGRLLRLDWLLLIRMSRGILEKAIAMGGSTISDFVNAGGKPGYFQLELAVYGKEGQACPRCQSPIVRSLIGGRASFHCPDCQRLRTEC